MSRELVIALLVVSAWAAGCSAIDSPTCEPIVFTFPRGMTLAEGARLSSDVEVLARGDDIDLGSSSIGSEGVGAQRVDVIDLHLRQEAVDRIAARQAESEDALVGVAVEGTIVVLPLSGFAQVLEAGLLRFVAPPSTAVDRDAVLQRCGATIAEPVTD